nr:hypothetical protein [Borrelia duttonii]
MESSLLIPSNFAHLVVQF